MNDRTSANNNWNAELYQEKHAFVWQYGSDLIEILAPRSPEIILDIGCGTGQLTNKIARSCRQAIGLDNSEEMIAKASQNYPNLKFIVADATNFNLPVQFDGIFSNAALHWIKPPAAAIASMYRALKPAGRLVVEFGGKGNVAQIIKAISATIAENNYQINGEVNPWYFPSISEYSTLLEQAGFEVNYAALFERMTALAGQEAGMQNWLKMFAGSIINNINQEQQQIAIEQTINKLRATSLYQNNSWFADYKRIRIVAKKKNY